MRGRNLADLARQRNWSHYVIRGQIKLLQLLGHTFSIDSYWIVDSLRQFQYKIDKGYIDMWADEMARREADKQTRQGEKVE